MIRIIYKEHLLILENKNSDDLKSIKQDCSSNFEYKNSLGDRSDLLVGRAELRKWMIQRGQGTIDSDLQPAGFLQNLMLFPAAKKGERTFRVLDQLVHGIVAHLKASFDLLPEQVLVEDLDQLGDAHMGWLQFFHVLGIFRVQRV